MPARMLVAVSALAVLAAWPSAAHASGESNCSTIGGPPDVYGGVIMWPCETQMFPSSNRLVQSVGGTVSDVPVAESSEFNLDLGPDENGGVAAVYERGSALYRYSVRTGVERKLDIGPLQGRNCKPSLPAVWEQTLVFYLSNCRGRPDGVYLQTPSGTQRLWGVRPSPNELNLSGSRVAAALSYGGENDVWVLEIGASRRVVRYSTPTPPFAVAMEGDFVYWSIVRASPNLEYGAYRATFAAGSTCQSAAFDMLNDYWFGIDGGVLFGNPWGKPASPEFGDPFPCAYDATVPVITEVRVSPRTFRVNSSVSTTRKQQRTPKGTNISYQLSEDATVRFSIERKTRGRRSGEGCEPPARRNRGHRRCTLYLQTGTNFVQAGTAGANSKEFSGKLGGRALKPGSYRLEIDATGVEHVLSERVTASFRIVR